MSWEDVFKRLLRLDHVHAMAILTSGSGEFLCLLHSCVSGHRRRLPYYQTCFQYWLIPDYLRYGLHLPCRAVVA